MMWLPVALVLAGCSRAAPAAQPTQPLARAVPIQTAAVALAQGQPCTGTFVPHVLDHTTRAGDKVVALYESNGSGVALNDLDGDRQIDIVLANLRGPDSILWNEGGLHFRTQRLPIGDSRAVSIVDVDGDGRQDIVFTRQFAKPAYLHNTGRPGDARFVVGVLPGVYEPFYSMNWGDLNGDGNLELVAASYDTELQKHEGPIFATRGGGVGVFVYQREGDTFVPQRLAKQADALTIALPDLDGDGRQDILVGNDFTRRDAAWLHSGTQWTATAPFKRTSENTMSIDVGDIDNDGTPEIFATDMKPYNQDVRTVANWRPMMQKMSHPSFVTDPQITENVLQMRSPGGSFRNQAYERRLDATGWSWSSKFGDLNNDGFLDVYVVNGMIANGLFNYLPNDELVEENRALRNDGHGAFAVAPEWGLGSTASGRGMSMADLDGDGRLDIVVNNLQSPAQLFENRLCGGRGLEVDLFWPKSHNRRALGARLVLHTSLGRYDRDVRAMSGYLSGDAARVHFGVPAAASLQQLEIRWPDGTVSTVEHPAPQTLVTVTR